MDKKVKMSLKSNFITRYNTDGTSWAISRDSEIPETIEIKWENPTKGCDNCGHGSDGREVNSVEIPTWVWDQLSRQVEKGRFHMRDAKP